MCETDCIRANDAVARHIGAVVMKQKLRALVKVTKYIGAM